MGRASGCEDRRAEVVLRVHGNDRFAHVNPTHFSKNFRTSTGQEQKVELQLFVLSQRECFRKVPSGAFYLSLTVEDRVEEGDLRASLLHLEVNSAL